MGRRSPRRISGVVVLTTGEAHTPAAVTLSAYTLVRPRAQGSSVSNAALAASHLANAFASSVAHRCAGLERR
jgi:hypothetical protein